MKITLKLFATFRQGRFKIDTPEIPEGTRIRDVLSTLEIEPEECGITLVNGRHAQLDLELSDDDTLSLFPKVGGG